MDAKNRGGPTRSISCSVLKGVEMTNETIKVVLMVMLLGGLRTAIFVTEMPKSQPRLVYQTFLDWMIALVWPAMPEPRLS
jgi:transposase